MPQDQLDEIIRKHGLYLTNKPGGVKADLRGADLSMANLSKADLRGADLSRADLSKANLSDANLRGADLSFADLSEANLRCADLSLADLYVTDMSGANLLFADMSWSDLRKADLSEADLTSANLARTDLREVDWNDANIVNIDLNLATTDETIRKSKCYFVEEIESYYGGAGRTCHERHGTQIVATEHEALRIAIDYARTNMPVIDYLEILSAVVEKVSSDTLKIDEETLTAGFVNQHAWIGRDSFLDLLQKAGIPFAIFQNALVAVCEDGYWKRPFVEISQYGEETGFVWNKLYFDIDSGCSWRIDCVPSKWLCASSFSTANTWREWKYKESPEPTADYAYLAAVRRDDMIEAQKILDQEARKAGYVGPVWYSIESVWVRHKYLNQTESPLEDNPKNQGCWFASDETVARDLARMATEKTRIWLDKVFLKLTNTAKWNRDQESEQAAIARAIREGADGVIFENLPNGSTAPYTLYLIFNNVNASTASLVIMDKIGHIVMPSRRFQQDDSGSKQNNQTNAESPPTPAVPPATPSVSSPDQSAPSTTQDRLSKVREARLNRYSPEERDLLNKIPWNKLPQALKDKTAENGDDPESQTDMDPEVPMGWP